MVEGSDPTPWKVVMARSLTRRCPRCGARTLFAGRLRMAESCTDCGHRFRRESGAMTGQMYLGAVVTEMFAAGLVFGLYFLTDWPTWVSLTVGLGLVLVFSYATLPATMGAWAGIEYLTDRVNDETWTRGSPGPRP